MKKSNFLLLLGLAIPAVLVFKSFLLSGPLAWGDAPFFYNEGLKELVGEPLAWTTQGNSLGGVNQFIFIWPLMFLYGLVGNLLGNDAAIRIIFYTPSLVLSLTGAWQFGKYLKISTLGRFFVAHLYVFNTYYLLLVDGGQVGVAFAYGLFPFSLLVLKDYFYKQNHQSFLVALIVLFLQTVADPRVGGIVILTFFIWAALEQVAKRKGVRKKNVGLSILLIAALISLGAYWTIPFFANGAEPLSQDVARLQFTSLLNGFYLFQPHWPGNQFGLISPPTPSFLLYPFLIFGGLVLKAKKEVYIFVALYLLFVLAISGTTPPLGLMYSWALDNLSFGFVFRDSSKFFVPLMLFAGVLVAKTVERVNRRNFSIFVFSYVLVTIFPALTGDLNFVLSSRKHSQDIVVISEKLSQGGGSRTAWFPEHHPLSLHTENNQAIDGADLVNFRPFALVNAGSFDRFNFLHSSNTVDWLRTFGVTHLVFSGNQRVVGQTDEQQNLWQTLLETVGNLDDLERLDWGVEMPVYKVPDPVDQVRSLGSLVALVGSDRFVEERDVLQEGYVYLEDELSDPRVFDGLAEDALTIFLNDTEPIDFTMTFLKEHFVSPGVAVSQWAVRPAENYLRYKYELLINELEFGEFDYGLGIAFSTVDGEKHSYKLPVDGPGDFVVAVRYLAQGDGMSISVNGSVDKVEGGDKLSWYTTEISGTRDVDVDIENLGGLQVVNAVAIVPKADWDEALRLSDVYRTHFGVVTSAEELSGLSMKSSSPEYQKNSPVSYSALPAENAYWLVLADKYDKNWKLRRGGEFYRSVPLFGSLTAFYVEPDWRDLELKFEGQQNVRWGIYATIVSGLVIATIFLITYPKKEK